MSGADAFTIMELLGHTDPSMSKKYIHLASSHKVNATERLEKHRAELLNKE